MRVKELCHLVLTLEQKFSLIIVDILVVYVLRICL